MAPPREKSARPQQAAPQPLSDRAAGVLEEIEKVMGRVEEASCHSVFHRDILTRRFQRWYSSLGTQLRAQLAPLLPQNDSAAEQ